jgi:hypothetical protein
MTSKHSSAILITALTLVVVILASAGASAGPAISIPQVHWDFGNVPQNSVLSAPYWIKNTGDDTLRIDVKPG